MHGILLHIQTIYKVLKKTIFTVLHGSRVIYCVKLRRKAAHFIRNKIKKMLEMKNNIYKLLAQTFMIIF
jgi:hypothetical protein